MGPDGVVLRQAKLDLRRFERRPDEVLLRRDLLDRQLINVEGARLVRANEIELALVAGSWRVVGVDTGPRGGLRRLLPKALGSHIATGQFLDWAVVEPFVGHVPTVRLRVPHPKLAKLHPAQIADLVEAASRSEGEEIIQAVGDDDRELEADVFEELDDHHQREFLVDRSDAEIAEILSRMAPDDAADIVGELDEERREPVLALLPVGDRVKVRALLGYDPAEAGGLMSPDFLLLPASTPAADAADAVRRSEIEPELLTVVFVASPQGALQGSVSVTALLRAQPGERLEALVKPHGDPSRERASAHARRGDRRRRARGDAPAWLAETIRPIGRGLNRLPDVSVPGGKFDGGPSTVRHAPRPVGQVRPTPPACPT
ncbi:MAG: magnesium transporter [Deltaproteobacteria bacterium]|nr:MAG: magnesium transporter [Deltaproteobacteria bacterium]